MQLLLCAKPPVFVGAQCVQHHANKFSRRSCSCVHIGCILWGAPCRNAKSEPIRPDRGDWRFLDLWCIFFLFGVWCLSMSIHMREVGAPAQSLWSWSLADCTVLVSLWEGSSELLLAFLVAGVASDALKVAEYREVLRLRRSLLQQGSWPTGKGSTPYQNFSRILSKVKPVRCIIWQCC